MDHCQLQAYYILNMYYAYAYMYVCIIIDTMIHTYVHAMMKF